MPYYFKKPTLSELTDSQRRALEETAPIALAGGLGSGMRDILLWRHIRNYKSDGRRSLFLTNSIFEKKYLCQFLKEESAEAALNIDCFRNIDECNYLKNYEEVLIVNIADFSLSILERIKFFGLLVSYSVLESENDEVPLNYSLYLDMLFPDNVKHDLPKKTMFPFSKLLNSLFPEFGTNIVNSVVKPNYILSDANEYSITTERQNSKIIEIINAFESSTTNIVIVVPFESWVNVFYSMLQRKGIDCSNYCNEKMNFTGINNVHITTFGYLNDLQFDIVILPNFHLFEKDLTNYKVSRTDYFKAFACCEKQIYLFGNKIIEQIKIEDFILEDYTK